MNYKYLQVKYGGQWVTLEGGENPHRAYWGQEEPPDDRYIEMPDVPRNKGYAEIAWEVGEAHQWRLSAAGGMGFMRFWQHALQGFLYGLLLGCLPTTAAGAVLLWLAVKYQTRESDDIRDKAWWDLRGIGAGTTIGSLITGSLSTAFVLHMLEIINIPYF